jgi:ribosomal protein L32
VLIILYYDLYNGFVKYVKRLNKHLDRNYIHFDIMTHFSCPKCGETYDAFPPDEKHRKASKFPDRNTMPVTNKCNICGTINRIYWRT